MEDEPQTMTVRVSRTALVEEFVQLEIPFYPGEQNLDLETRAHRYVEAALEAGQALDWRLDDARKTTKDKRLIARTIPF